MPQWVLGNLSSVFTTISSAIDAKWPQREHGVEREDVAVPTPGSGSETSRVSRCVTSCCVTDHMSAGGHEAREGVRWISAQGPYRVHHLDCCSGILEIHTLENTMYDSGRRGIDRDSGVSRHILSSVEGEKKNS